MIEKSVRKAEQRFLVSNTTVTLNEGQGYSNWYKTIQFSHVYHKSNSERNQSVNVWMQTAVLAYTVWERFLCMGCSVVSSIHLPSDQNSQALTFQLVPFIHTIKSHFYIWLQTKSYVKKKKKKQKQPPLPHKKNPTKQQKPQTNKQTTKNTKPQRSPPPPPPPIPPTSAPPPPSPQKNPKPHPTRRQITYTMIHGWMLHNVPNLYKLSIYMVQNTNKQASKQTKRPAN